MTVTVDQKSVSTPLPEGRWPKVGETVLYRPHWLKDDQVRPAMVLSVQAADPGVPFLNLSVFLIPTIDWPALEAMAYKDLPMPKPPGDPDLRQDTLWVGLATHGPAGWRFRDVDYDNYDERGRERPYPPY